ncbi:hypothetical protein AABB24_038708, partial [Solanum stoloniferum]
MGKSCCLYQNSNEIPQNLDEKIKGRLLPRKLWWFTWRRREKRRGGVGFGAALIFRVCRTEEEEDVGQWGRDSVLLQFSAAVRDFRCDEKEKIGGSLFLIFLLEKKTLQNWGSFGVVFPVPGRRRTKSIGVGSLF